MKLETPALFAVAVLLTAALSSFANAQTWPAKPVRVVVSFPPGGGLDFIARLLTRRLTDQVGTSFLVDNRPGAGILGVELVARAAADGYTLLAVGPEFAINPSVRPTLTYDPFRDFTYISQLTSGQYLLASHPSVPVESIKQLIALAKAKPDLLNYGSSGAGGLNHLAGELFQSQAGIKWVHVPYKGTGPNLTGLMGGEVDLSFASLTALARLAEAGKVRPIAVTGLKRSPALPDVPTIAESGLPAYNVTGYGLLAPAGINRGIVRRVQSEAAQAMNSPEVKEQLAKVGTVRALHGDLDDRLVRQSRRPAGGWRDVPYCVRHRSRLCYRACQGEPIRSQSRTSAIKAHEV